MVIKNKCIQIPLYFIFNNIEIKCVEEFQLLGVTIDSKLNFNKHVSILSHTNNSKLFAIKNLFYLSSSVKVQFFKTFILPYFDYCSTLFIYAEKAVIQRLCNKYCLCLYVLFNLDLYNFTDFDQLNKYLIKKFNIPAFQHRIILRLSIFSFKMLNFVSAPKILKEVIVKNFQEKSLIEKPDLVDDNKESVFIPENTRTFRNGETFSTKHDVV